MHIVGSTFIWFKNICTFWDVIYCNWVMGQKAFCSSQVGEFYEAIGIDACLLVEFAGLNPFGGLRSDSIPRAGCPVMVIYLFSYACYLWFSVVHIVFCLKVYYMMLKMVIVVYLSKSDKNTQWMFTRPKALYGLCVEIASWLMKLQLDFLKFRNDRHHVIWTISAGARRTDIYGALVVDHEA